MRYECFGRKNNFVGKTLWEIVGNLKNFGVGRLVKKSSTESYPELSFFKIVKVQPVPPPKLQYLERNVIVWIEEVFRDRKLPITETFKLNNVADFKLIPKDEEEYYLERLKNLKAPVLHLNKYCKWPPLYKMLWEKDEKYGPIPLLECVHQDYPGCEVVLNEEELKESTCSLHKGELTVEELYKEVVKLKLLIKQKTQP